MIFNKKNKYVIKIVKLNNEVKFKSKKLIVN